MDGGMDGYYNQQTCDQTSGESGSSTNKYRCYHAQNIGIWSTKPALNNWTKYKCKVHLLVQKRSIVHGGDCATVPLSSLKYGAAHLYIVIQTNGWAFKEHLSLKKKLGKLSLSDLWIARSGTGMCRREDAANKQTSHSWQDPVGCEGKRLHTEIWNGLSEASLEIPQKCVKRRSARL